MSFFNRCTDCGTNRLTSVAECPTCQLRKIHGACRCLRPIVDGRCTHCDQDCDARACTHCAELNEAWKDAKAGMAETPHPTPDELLEPPVIPVGAIAICGTCGSRAYVTGTGAIWCPRPFCADGSTP